MKESATLRLEPSRIEKILFDYYFKDLDQVAKNKIEKTFKVKCNVKTKISLISISKSAEFVVEYYTPINSLGGAICQKIVLSLSDFNNIINEIVSSNGYEIDYLDIESIKYPNINYANFSSTGKETLACIEYNLKKKEKEKIKARGRK